MKWTGIIGIVAIAVVLTGHRADGGVEDTLKMMQPGDRLDYVITKIEERDAALQNYECQVTKTTQKVNIHTNTIIEQFDTAVMIFRRNGGTIWSQSDSDIRVGKPANTTLVSWDGKLSRGYTQEHAGKKRLGGSIRATEPEVFTWTRFNNVLGFRTLGGGASLTLPQWATKKRMLTDVVLTVELAEVDGQTLVGLRTVGQGSGENRGIATYWMDPARGFMIAKYEFSDGRTKVEHSVKDAQLVDGVWLPTKAMCAVGGVDADWRTEDIYQVNSFKLNSVKDEDVKVVFPVGCEVVDTTLQLAWKVTANGIEMMPIADPKTGGVIDPRSPQVQKAINEVMDDVLENSGHPGPVYFPSSPPVSARQPVVAVQQPAQEPTSRVWPYIVGAALVVIAGAGIWKIRRKAR